MGDSGSKNEFMAKYKAYGDDKFYRFLLVYALNKLIAIEKDMYSGDAPNIEFLNYYNQLLASYRSGGDKSYLQAAKLFRKASHRIYRIMLKKEMTNIDSRFLNLIAEAK